jgi:hypothetical protein
MLNSPLNPADMPNMMPDTLTKSASGTLEDDRRRSERCPYVAEAWIWSPTSTDPADRIEVTSLNLSRHGLGFSMPTPLPTGSFHMVEIGVGPQRITSEIRIISCRWDEELQTHEIGAEFC